LNVLIWLFTRLLYFFLSQASFLPTEAVGRTYFRQLEHFLVGGLAGSLRIRLQPEVARLVRHNQQVLVESAKKSEKQEEVLRFSVA
jgi:hypothetical protein